MRKSSRGLLACLSSPCWQPPVAAGAAAVRRNTPPAPLLPRSTEPPAKTFTLSGTITTSASQSVDSDTNDPTRPAVSNDTPANPQTIPNPITLGGYINQPGTGAEGRSQVSGDIDDYFLVDLLAGQSVTLLVADYDQADADLYLLDRQGNVVDFSVDTGEVESLLIPRDGTYLVNAFAFSGATNYILAIGAPNTPTQYNPLEHRIVPWQAVVTYKDETRKSGNSPPSEAITRRLGLEQRAGGRGRGRLMALHRGLVTAQQAWSSAWVALPTNSTSPATPMCARAGRH